MAVSFGAYCGVNVRLTAVIAFTAGVLVGRRQQPVGSSSERIGSSEAEGGATGASMHEDVALEVLRQAEKKLEAQLKAGEILRARLTSTTQQAVTLASAAVVGFATVATSTSSLEGMKAGLQWSLGIALSCWITAAIAGLRSLRSMTWHELGIRYSSIPNKAKALPPNLFYTDLSKKLNLPIKENEALRNTLADGLDNTLGLIAFAVPASCAAFAVWLLPREEGLWVIVALILAGLMFFHRPLT